MLLLVIDTSGRNGSVALAGAAGDGTISLIESVPLSGGTFSAQLVPQVAALLSKHGFGKRDLAAFVVISGPGSFTGLRVGLAAVKALSEILHKPIVPVSLLEAVAISGPAGKVLAVLDAGRGEVYVGEYEVAGEEARSLREIMVPREKFLAMTGNSAVVACEETLITLAREAGIEAMAIPRPDATGIARLGWKKLQSGRCTAPEQLDANYIRRSDAEILKDSS